MSNPLAKRILHSPTRLTVATALGAAPAVAQRLHLPYSGIRIRRIHPHAASLSRTGISGLRPALAPPAPLVGGARAPADRVRRSDAHGGAVLVRSEPSLLLDSGSRSIRRPLLLVPGAPS